MFLTKHELTEGEKACLEQYEREKSPTPRKNLIKLVRHMNMLNPLPDEKSWEYIFLDRQVTDEQVDFALKMKRRHLYRIGMTIIRATTNTVMTRMLRFLPKIYWGK